MDKLNPQGLPEGVQRQSKADTLRFAIIAKHPLNCLLFLLPKKHGLLFGVPESRKTLRGKGATERQRRQNVCMPTKASIATCER